MLPFFIQTFSNMKFFVESQFPVEFYLHFRIKEIIIICAFAGFFFQKVLIFWSWFDLVLLLVIGKFHVPSWNWWKVYLMMVYNLIYPAVTPDSWLLLSRTPGGLFSSIVAKHQYAKKCFASFDINNQSNYDFVKL